MWQKLSSKGTEQNGDFSHVNNAHHYNLCNSSLCLYSCMLSFLTMELFRYMTKNRDFKMTLDPYEKWNKAKVTPHLTFASCAQNFGDKNSLKLCLFTKPAKTYILLPNFDNNLWISHFHNIQRKSWRRISKTLSKN